MNGWCSHQVKHLSRTYDSETFPYLATLKRSAYRLADHTHCSEHAACIAYNTNLTNYTTRHVTEDCACSTVSTPYKQLTKITQQGNIPLLSIEGGTHASVPYTLRVHSRSRTSEYVAVSHVWADGLGNPKANWLHGCQIKRLHASLIALQEVFGKDDVRSLCEDIAYEQCLLIPRATCCSGWIRCASPLAQLLQLIQIDKMASIYKGAMTSLVLDAELMTVVPKIATQSAEALGSHRNASTRSSKMLHVEARTRIACSVWMSRSWTFQEGELPPTVTVQYLNTAVVMGRPSKNDGRYMKQFTSETMEPVGHVTDSKI
jgi:hypothetical protein